MELNLQKELMQKDENQINSYRGALIKSVLTNQNVIDRITKGEKATITLLCEGGYVLRGDKLQEARDLVDCINSICLQ